MASPLQAVTAARRAGKVAELVDEARRINPPDRFAGEWARIAESAEPGGIAASAPEPVPVTFRDAVSRWYENTPGGFDAAVENSQRALKEHGVVYPHSNSPAYGTWRAEDVDSPTQVRVNWSLGPFDARGTYRASGRDVHINPLFLDAAPKGRNPTVEHELTHSLMDKSRPSSPSEIAAHQWQNARKRFDGTTEGSVTLSRHPKLAAKYDGGGPDAPAAEQTLRALVGDERYLMQRAELDPRLAEVRRRYAFYTGRDVVTPEDAANAWEWWRTNREWLEDLSTPTDTPSMIRSQFDTYDALPESSKSIMFRRMTQVPAVLAPIAVGAAASQEQPGVLNGLRSN